MNMEDLEDFLEDRGIVFLSYGGTLSQELISGMIDALEKESEKNNLSMSTATNLFTIFVELLQNMMNYAKSRSSDSNKPNSKGLVIIGYVEAKDEYYVMSRNVISDDDRVKISEKLDRIKTMSKDEIRKEYRALRRSGKDKHEVGAGIGFLEIAKRCDTIDYKVKEISGEKHQFSFQANIMNK